ncbi:MAG TPA: HAD-IIIA family hydrolase [Acidimicrobiales bacterium]|nr:HAD-IIIA family hydrolase [Acidimicrobiales bacterium]
MGKPGILLDRDGTIIVDHRYVGSIDRVEFIEGAPEAIASFNRAGIPVAVITNQAGVARGYFGLDDVEKVHQHITDRLAEYDAHIDLFLFCPYHPAGVVQPFARYSSDRKPEPGMALAAARALDLDLSSSWIVGDHASDMAVAAAVGACGVFLGPSKEDDPGVWSFPDLATAGEFILENIGAHGLEDGLSLLRAPGPAARPKFPVEPFHYAATYCQAYFSELTETIGTIDLVAVERAAATLIEAYDRGAAVFACGNGGSASISNHVQCDHLKGVRVGTGLWPRVTSLSCNVELMTAIANDIGYEEVFVYQLQSHARPGDVLVAISSSGQSPNILRALEWSRANGLRTIALTGFSGGEARSSAEISIHVESANYGIVEDAHQSTMHLLAQYIRQSRMSPEVIATLPF